MALALAMALEMADRCMQIAASNGAGIEGLAADSVRARSRQSQF